MNKMKHGMVLALKEHLIAGNSLTQLESIVLFGVPLLSREISRMRKEGWIIDSQKVLYAKALLRLNEYAHLEPPKNLPSIYLW